MTVTPRSGFLERYKGVAIIVDASSEAAALTPPDFAPSDGPFDMLLYKTGESLTGREFNLEWTIDGQYAAVFFIEIDYNEPSAEPGTPKFLISHLKHVILLGY